MKTFCLAVSLALSASGVFAGSTSVLLTGTASGAITHALIDHDVSVNADSITFDTPVTKLICVGAVELRRGTVSMKTKECVIELGSDAKVFIQDPNGVTIAPNKSLDSTPASVTSAANAPVAPPTGAGHH